MFLTRIACVLSLLCLAACDRLPDSYPPPEQRHPVAGFNPAMGADAMMVAMDSSDADLLIVKDIYESKGISWRWTKQEPTIRIPLLSTENLKFSTRFRILARQLQNHRPARDLVPGEAQAARQSPLHHVPATSISKSRCRPIGCSGGNEATVALSVDKLYTAPTGRSQIRRDPHAVGLNHDWIFQIVIHVIPILLGALFTIATAWSLGMLLLRHFGAFYDWERRLLRVRGWIRHV